LRQVEKHTHPIALSLSFSDDGFTMDHDTCNGIFHGYGYGYLPGFLHMTGQMRYGNEWKDTWLRHALESSIYGIFLNRLGMHACLCAGGRQVVTWILLYTSTYPYLKSMVMKKLVCRVDVVDGQAECFIVCITISLFFCYSFYHSLLSLCFPLLTSSSPPSCCRVFIFSRSFSLFSCCTSSFSFPSAFLLQTAR
jgi:hypothetical protein